ncbi:MAG: 5-formyltetrahydrofolate cyclo-ligase [Gammaproteobacteria bacterium]|nr:5-formyltetrahydrofolate cyclo-ligase [Gammaproteobacteria bacterium]
MTPFIPSRGVFVFDRQILRKALRTARAGLSAAERARSSRLIARWIAGTHWLAPGRRVAIFMSMPEEIDTAPLIELAHRRGCELFFPRIENLRQRRLGFTPPDANLLRNRLGIVEFGGAARKAAAAMQIIFVPLVGFDRRGNRLGMGAGFYDRALAFRRRRQHWRGPVLIGIAHSCQQTSTIEPLNTDVPLDVIVTERGIGFFRGEKA